MDNLAVGFKVLDEKVMSLKKDTMSEIKHWQPLS